MYRKNVASQNLPFALVKASDGSALTGATVTARRSIDGGAQANCTGTVSEMGNGQYNLALSQTDTNGNQIGILLTATNAIPVHFSIVTTAANPTDAAAFGLTNLDAAISSRLASASISLSGGAVTVGTNNDKTGYGLANNAVDAAQFTQAAADKVWSSASRSLTSFGTLVADVATAVWGAATRTLTAISDSAGVTTLLSRLSAGRATNLDNLDATVSSRSTQISVDDLPTNAELATALAAADDAVLAAIAALNNASVAAISAAVGALTVAELPDNTLVPATPTLLEALALQHMVLRNGGTFNKDTGVSTIKNDAGQVIMQRTDTDDGTTFTEGKLVAA